MSTSTCQPPPLLFLQRRIWENKRKQEIQKTKQKKPLYVPKVGFGSTSLELQSYFEVKVRSLSNLTYVVSDLNP